MYNAYQSAKVQVENNTSEPITIKFQNDKYEIKHDALQNAVAAIQLAASLNTNTAGRQRSRGFMGSYAIRKSELAYSTLYARALDRFIFTDECVGACLHQGPCRKWDPTAGGNPEAADVYIVPFDSFCPQHPVSLTDLKVNVEEFPIADRESSLYSITGVTVGDDNSTWPLLIGVPGTPMRSDLQLHVVVPRSMWKLTIASGYPWDGALLCTLNAAACHLCKHKCLITLLPLVSPSPFSDMAEYSIKGPRNRVFLNKKTETVYKFYDTQTDGFLHPPVMKELIEKVQPLAEMKLSSYPGDRLFMLSYKYITGVHEAFKYKNFLGVIKVLSKMHEHAFVHGDIRWENMVFPEDGDSYLIDFDFVGKDTEDTYPCNFNCDLPGRHPNAIPNMPMKLVHDRYSLVKILERLPVVNGFVKAREDINRNLLAISCPLKDVVTLLATVDY